MNQHIQRFYRAIFHGFLVFLLKDFSTWTCIFNKKTKRRSYFSKISDCFNFKYLKLMSPTIFLVSKFSYKIKQYIINLRKWGGFFIVVGALSPIPHSLVSIGAGLIGYKFKHYLLWSLFRYFRFLIYYILILQVL